mgnify:CR=1 FL=1
MKKTWLATMVAFAVTTTAAHAEVNINGFASIKAGKASSGDSLYGYTDEIDFKNESLFAVQWWFKNQRVFGGFNFSVFSIYPYAVSPQICRFHPPLVQ